MKRLFALFVLGVFLLPYTSLATADVLVAGWRNASIEDLVFAREQIDAQIVALSGQIKEEAPHIDENYQNVAYQASFGFIDQKMFSQSLIGDMSGRVLRCGSDFEPGNYFIFSLWGANALYGVADNPNDFTYSYERMIRKIHVEKGQYIMLLDAVLVRAEEIDTDDWKEYGVYHVGKDIPAGEYKIKTISDRYSSDSYSIDGIMGAYQITKGSPENEPIECASLFFGTTYIAVKEGEYVAINNAEMTLCADSYGNEVILPAPTPSPIQMPTPIPTETPIFMSTVALIESSSNVKTIGDQYNIQEQGISEGCYERTLELTKHYCSEEYKGTLFDLYVECKYGEDDYDYSVLEVKKKELENEKKNAYAQIYGEYTEENDREIILFGYNLSEAYKMSFSMSIMFEIMGNEYNDEKIDYYDDFLNRFIEAPSLDLVDEFCVYYVKNNVGEYVTNISVIDIAHIADEIDLDIEFANMYIELATQFLNNGDVTSSYESYSAGMECLLSILDTLDEYPEYKNSFVSADVSDMREVIKKSTSLLRNVADDYAKGDRSALGISTISFVLVLEEVMGIVEEIGGNCSKY